MSYLLDTNIVIALLNNNQQIKSKLAELRRRGKEVYISGLTYYEIKRALLMADAEKQLYDFNQFCTEYEVLLLDDLEMLEIASEVDVYLRKRQIELKNINILVAAIAITKGLILVSDNPEIQTISGVIVENWL